MIDHSANNHRSLYLSISLSLSLPLCVCVSLSVSPHLLRRHLIVCPVHIPSVDAHVSPLSQLSPSSCSRPASFISAHLIRSPLNWPQFILAERQCTVKRPVRHDSARNFVLIGRSHGVLGRFTAYSLYSVQIKGQLKYGRIRWDKMSDMNAPLYM